MRIINLQRRCIVFLITQYMMEVQQIAIGVPRYRNHLLRWFLSSSLLFALFQFLLRTPNVYLSYEVLIIFCKLFLDLVHERQLVYRFVTRCQPLRSRNYLVAIAICTYLDSDSCSDIFLFWVLRLILDLFLIIVAAFALELTGLAACAPLLSQDYLAVLLNVLVLLWIRIITEVAPVTDLVGV